LQSVMENGTQLGQQSAKIRALDDRSSDTGKTETTETKPRSNYTQIIFEGVESSIKLSRTIKVDEPLIKNGSSMNAINNSERVKNELRAIYTDWAGAAVAGDWHRHMSHYARRVEYFRNGLLPRSKVEERKQRIFSGLDSYRLHFSDNPQIAWRSLHERASDAEADLTFEREWILQRGQKRVNGKALGLIRLRHGLRGWYIVSERQIGRYK